MDDGECRAFGAKDPEGAPVVPMKVLPLDVELYGLDILVLFRVRRDAMSWIYQYAPTLIEQGERVHVKIAGTRLAQSLYFPVLNDSGE